MSHKIKLFHEIRLFLKDPKSYLKTYWEDIHDVTTNRFLKFISFCFALSFVSVFLNVLAASDSLSNPLARNREILSFALSNIFFFILILYINSKNVLYWLSLFLLCTIVLLADIFYLKYIPLEIQSTKADACLTLLSLYMVAFYTHATCFLIKYLYGLMKRILKEILDTESTGLKKILECIASIVLSISTLIAGIYSLISSFGLIFQYFKR